MTEVRGPVSYFPTIEAKYGRTIDEWKAAMRATGLQKPKELIDWLKAEHGFGHGHAAAITHHLLAEGTTRGTTDDQVNGLFTAKKAHWRPAYDRLAEAIAGLGDVKVLPKKGMVGFAKTKAQFTVLAPSTPDRFDIGLKLPGVAPTARLADADGWYTSMTHRVQLSSPDQVDDELLGWVRQAYEASR